MSQFGLDAQMTTDEWLWKLEIIKRKWSADNFLAYTAGFEYTFVGIYESNSDLGLVIEYLNDDRDMNTTGFFQNDLLTAIRWTLNDEQSSELLLGTILDLDTDEVLLSIEASRRIGNNSKLTLEARSFSNTSIASPAYNFRKDDFIQLDIAYYF